MLVEKIVNRKVIIVNIICLLLVILAQIGYHVQTEALVTGQAYRRWANGGDGFAQVSCFIPENLKFTADNINLLRTSIKQGREEYSGDSESNENGSLVDAYSAMKNLNVKNNRVEYKADVFGVGGDFFFFHQLKLASGSYFSDENVMKDLAVLDEKLAWELFGSVDILGQTISINGENFKVCGVVKLESRYAAKKTNGVNPKLFVSYERLKKVLDSDLPITCYETVMQEPNEKFTYHLIETKLGEYKEQVEIKEVSSRFRKLTLLAQLKSYWNRIIRTKPIAYPFWENALLICESLSLACLIVKYISIVYLIGTDGLFLYRILKSKAHNRNS